MGFWTGILIGCGLGSVGLIALLLGIPWWLARKGPTTEEFIKQQFGPRDPPSDPQASEAEWLDYKHVPEELHEVLPAARKFGIGCDVLRGEVVQAASSEERAQLVAVMRKHFVVIQKWLDFTRGVAMPEWLVPVMYARDAAELVESPLHETCVPKVKEAP